MIKIDRIDENYVRCVCDDSTARELQEHFTFEVPNAKFNPKVRSGMWDGKIRLFNLRDRKIYAGLADRIREFAADRNYEVETSDSATEELSLTEAEEFVKTLGLSIEPRDYQIRALALAVRNRRCVLVSPTASGKSLIAYMIARWYDKKTLIVVPTKSLVTQMIGDFASYGYAEQVHGIMGGVEKDSDCQFVVSTWQSIFEMPRDWFEQFEVVIGDEAHGFKAKSLTAVMTSMPHVAYRIGMTGTLDGMEVNQLVLEGLFGRVERVTDTATLIERGDVASLKIKILLLKHPPEDAKLLVDCDYHQEIDYLIGCTQRNKFIANLATSLKGNVLVLFTRVEAHGRILHSMITETIGADRCVFVSGTTDVEDREYVRALAERTNDTVIVASYGTFSTGINIRNLHNVIFASPSKSRVRTLQSIGRGLRNAEGKTWCKLFDVADDLTVGRKRNYTLNHLVERVKMYSQEKFPFETHEIRLKSRSSS